MAQGQISVAGYTARGQGATVTKGVPTAGRIPNGAIVEREVAFDIRSMKSIDIALRNPDFTTAERIAQAINTGLHQSLASALDSGTVKLSVPDSAKADMVGFITSVEQLRVEPDQIARVVIDEANGIIVMGENVRISTVAVAQGSLTVRITETPQVSQPNAFAPGGNAAAPPLAGRRAKAARNSRRMAVPRPRSCRAPTSRSTNRTTSAWPCCRRALRSRNWSTA